MKVNDMNTTELLNKLQQTTDIKSFLSQYEHEYLTYSVSTLLGELAEQKKLSVATIARQSGQGEYVYKVFRGERKPSRDIVISIAIGMTLTLAETQLFLRVAKFSALDPRDKRDSVIIYGIKEALPIEKLNDLLYEMQELTL